MLKDGSLMANQRRLLFNAMSRDWTASDGATRGGPLRAVQRPITADETLLAEQLVRQLAGCKCCASRACENGSKYNAS